MKNRLKKLLLIGCLFVLPMQAHAAKMALSPGSGEFKTGCVNSVGIIVNTEGENTMAADAFLRFNPDEIEILDMNSSVSGVQIKINGIYESYPGNIVTNGRIKMTAFNRAGFFNGRGTLGTIVFKNKPGVERATIYFEFSPGASTDSNVANPDALDVLNAAYGGTYTFVTGACGSDKSPPKIEKKYPDMDAMLAPLDANIEFIIRDDQSGVNLDTLRVDVNGKVYSKEGENQFRYEGDANKYRIIIDPQEDFPDRQPVGVKIQAQDYDGNTMKDEIYSFNRLIPVEACQVGGVCKDITYSCPENDLKPSAMEKIEGISKGGRYIILILLIFLLISLITNVWQFTEPVEKDEKKLKPRKTVKKTTKKKKK